MQESNGFASSRRGVHRRVLPLVAALVVFLAAAPQAGATIRVQNATDPAGDQTPMTYSISGAAAPITFQLAGATDRSVGPGPGTYVIQAAPAAGWQVADIQCVSNETAPHFTVDIPNGRVTVNHAQGFEDTCAFTNRRIGAAGSPAQAASPGIAPAPPPKEGAVLPKRAALVNVAVGLRFAAATVRVTRPSVIKGQLLFRGTRVVGTARIVRRAAGTYTLRVRLSSAGRRLLAGQGRKRVSLTLRVVVTPAGGKAAQVFRFGVRVRL
jgi:hypothetical protein